jgi:hypothetical protein
MRIDPRPRRPRRVHPSDAHIVPKLADVVPGGSVTLGKPLRIIIFTVIIRWRIDRGGAWSDGGIAPPG